MIDRCRRRMSSLGMEAAVPALETDRALRIVVATFAGALAGALAGLLISASLMIVSATHVDRSATDILVGTAFGALAFAILANQE